jgi:hypothetical protein
MTKENQEQPLKNSSTPILQPQNSIIVDAQDTTHHGINKPDNPNGQGQPPTLIDKTNNRIMRATIVIAAATCIYAVIASLQWCTMSKQLDIANGQLLTMQKQLELTDRSWIKLNLALNGPLTFKDRNRNIFVFFNVIMKNIGHSTAIKVKFAYDVYLAPFNQDFFKEPLKRQKELCNRLSTESPDALHEVVDTIMPGDEYIGATSGGATITKSSLIHLGTLPAFIDPIVYGCVDYQYGSSTTHHSTPFVYHITQPDPLTGHNKMIVIGHNIPADKLTLERYFYGGLPAN